MDNKIEKIKQGKKNRQAGARFELRVRADLEKEGWIVAKWTNNVEFMCTHKEKCCARLVKVKNKFRGKGIPMMLGAGFPDFIAFRYLDEDVDFIKKGDKCAGVSVHRYEIIGVEVKSKGYLSKEEKEKVDWLLEKNVFSKVLIAMKDPNKRGGIIYKEYGNKN